ncbi:MAG: DUF4383 domain-containing protein [Thermoleophilaceae bacterium]|nr:DUF4383 domain-containing protein [Thermoleophilaceae bacterium]
MHQRSAAQLYSLVFGVLLVAGGIIGFFYTADFAVGDAMERERALLLDVNGWHNTVHLLTGAIGLAVAGSAAAARSYALILGVVYLLLAILGFLVFGDTVLQILPLNTEDNILHLLIGAAGIGTYTASSPSAAPSTI